MDLKIVMNFLLMNFLVMNFSDARTFRDELFSDEYFSVELFDMYNPSKVSVNLLTQTLPLTLFLP
jgi:hypothetical protein